MKRPGLKCWRIDGEGCALSEFRVNSARILEGLSETRGFAYLTKNGYSVAVVADVEEFERMYGYAIDHGYKAGRDEQSE